MHCELGRFTPHPRQAMTYHLLPLQSSIAQNIRGWNRLMNGKHQFGDWVPQVEQLEVWL
ncbi:MAG: hypothetical protein NVSMB62_19130 [Acidobacteriaceae bacterium]